MYCYIMIGLLLCYQYTCVKLELLREQYSEEYFGHCTVLNTSVIKKYLKRNSHVHEH